MQVLYQTLKRYKQRVKANFHYYQRCKNDEKSSLMSEF